MSEPKTCWMCDQTTGDGDCPHCGAPLANLNRRFTRFDVHAKPVAELTEPWCWWGLPVVEAFTEDALATLKAMSIEELRELAGPTVIHRARQLLIFMDEDKAVAHLAMEVPRSHASLAVKAALLLEDK